MPPLLEAQRAERDPGRLARCSALQLFLCVLTPGPGLLPSLPHEML